MKGFMWFVAAFVLVCLAVTPAQATFYWEKAGADPNQLPAYESLKALGLRNEVISCVFGDGRPIMVGDGDSFVAMTFGSGEVREDVVVKFGNWEIADTWSVEWAETKWVIYRFRICGNWAYQWEDLPQGTTVPEPTSVPTATYHLPWWWWLGLLGLLGLFGLLRRQGPRGPRGLQGPKGDPGPAGKDGKDGKDGVVAAVAPAVNSSGGSSAAPHKDNPPAVPKKNLSAMSPEELQAYAAELQEKAQDLRDETLNGIIPALKEAEQKVAERDLVNKDTKTTLQFIGLALGLVPEAKKEDTTKPEKPGDC